MSNLAKLQEDFANHLYEEGNLDVVPAINFNNIPVEKRLNIYRNNVFGGFCEALELTYQTVKQIVGEDYFNYLTTQYNQKYISTSGNLEDYGEYFWKLIESFESKHKLNYLKDIAKLEWFHNLSYLSKSSRNINMKKLQSLGEDEFMKLYFSLHPSCHLISSKYPTYSIWSMNQNNTDQEINLEEKEGEFILIHRAGSSVSVIELPEIEFVFLSMIDDNKSIYQIYETMGVDYIDNQFDIGAFVNKFISSRIITKFIIKDYAKN